MANEVGVPLYTSCSVISRVSLLAGKPYRSQMARMGSQIECCKLRWLMLTESCKSAPILASAETDFSNTVRKSFSCKPHCSIKGRNTAGLNMP
ncbi:Uncharacterised protein [Vibrio cholerae]|nr:Uncharacterised protein [Vibrio cholerae]CSI37186.1 Uncharacterised protein [Vibrio cholerae]